jgi:hypothetical protein
MSGLTEHATDALKGFGTSAGRSVKPLENLDKELVDKQDDMHAVDRAVERLANSIGVDLPKNAHRGTEKFKRSAMQISGMERMISHGFDLMREGIYKLNQILQVNRLQAFLDAVNLHKLTEIGHGLAHIGTAGGQLTTSYEAAAQAASVSTRKVVASSGVWGKELDKLNSQAAGFVMGMKVSEQTAGHAAVAFNKFKRELTAVGITTAATGVKLEDAMGIPIMELAQNLGQMRKDLNLTDKDLDEITKQFTATGDAIHDMQVPFQQMPHLLELARNRANLLTEGLSDIGGKDVLKSVNASIRALYAITGDAKSAVDTSVALESALSGAMNNFGKLFAGTTTDLDNFLVNTSVVTGDVRQAFAMARKGPMEFLKSFSTVVVKLKKSGKPIGEVLNFFEHQMEEALGPEAAKMIIGFFRNMNVEQLATMNTNKALGKSMGNMANEAWRSSMTLQESFDLMMGSAESRFRRIGKAATMTFVHQTGKAFDTFNEKASALVKEGGPLGKLVQKMAEISFMGAKALLPQALQPIAMLFGHLSPMVFEAVTAFTQLGPILMHLVNPFTILIGLVTLFHFGLKQTEAHLKAQNKEYQNNAKAIASAEKQLKGIKKGTDVYNAALARLSKMQHDQGQLEARLHEESRKAFAKALHDKIKTFVDGAKQIASHIPDVIKEISDAFHTLASPPPEGIDWKDIWKSVSGMATQAFHGIGDLGSGLLRGFMEGADPKTAKGKGNAETLGMQIGGLLREAFDVAYGKIKSYLTGWWKRMGAIWEDTNKPFGDKVRQTAEGSAGILIGAFAIGKFTPVFQVLGLFGPVLGGISKAALLLGKNAIWPLVEAFVGLTGGLGVALLAVAGLTAAFYLWPDQARAAVDKVVDWIRSGISSVVEWSVGKLLSLFDPSGPTVESMLTDVASLGMRLVHALTGVFDIAPKLIIGIFAGIWDGIEKAFINKFPESVGVIKNFFDSVRDVFKYIGDVVTYIMNPLHAVDDLFGWVDKKLGTKFGKKVAEPVAEATKDVAASLPKVLQPGIDQALKSTQDIAAQVQTSTKDIAASLPKDMQPGIDQAIQSTKGIAAQVQASTKDIAASLPKDMQPGIDQALKSTKDIAAQVQASTKDIAASIPQDLQPGIDQAIKSTQDLAAQVQTNFKAIADSLPTTLQPGMDQAVQVVQAGTKAMSDGLASGFQDGMSKAAVQVQTTMTDIAASLPAALQPGIDQSIKVVQDGAQEISRTLASSFQDGMNQAVVSVEQSTDAIAKQVEKVFYDKISVSITDSFMETFQIVIKQTKKFMDVLGKGFADFANAVNHLFRDMWLRSLADTDISVQAMKNSVASSIRDMKTLQAAMDNLRNTRAEMLKDAATPGEVGESIKLKPGQSMEQALLDQTADPKWYRDDYRDLFISEMAKLAGAIRSMPVQSGGTSAGQAYQRLAGKGKGAVEAPLPAPGGSFPSNFGLYTR